MSLSQIQNEREDENQAIDRMFAFVKQENMETPKSSIITRHRSISTPRRPLATSTPLFPSQNVIMKPKLKISANDLKVQKIEESITNSTTNDTSTITKKFDDSIAAAISQHQEFQAKCRAILSDISFQQDQIIQASDIIAMCQKKFAFNGTFQEMNAQRSLLVANERRYALHRELDRLKKSYNNKQINNSRLENGDCEDTIDIPPPKCAVNITSIKILLNRSFYIKTVDEEISYAFVTICKTDDQMYATQLMNVLDMGTLRVSTVQFRESIRFQNLPTDFTILLEIYALKIVKRSISTRYACASKIANKAKAFIGGSNKKSIAVAVETIDSFFPASDFHRCGYLYLNRSTMSKQQIFLKEVEYPLEGTAEVRCEYIFV